MTASNALHDVRPSALAGRWYPAQADQLARAVEQFISRADPVPVRGQIIGLLAPHAGHRYCGAVAGSAYRAIRDLDADVVAVVGPSHYGYPAEVLTTGHAAYETPLGVVPVDQAALGELGEMLPLHAVRADPEHALEIELPFLQRTLGDFRLIPLALIDQSLAMARRVGEALGHVLAGQKALLVASSDLSHFYPQPAANAFDAALLDAVRAFDPVAVIEADEQGKGFACGRAAIAAVMIAAKLLGADQAQVVGYATSGDVTGDFSQVVGYGAAVFYRADAG